MEWRLNGTELQSNVFVIRRSALLILMLKKTEERGEGRVCLLLLERGVNIRKELPRVLQFMLSWEANGVCLRTGCVATVFTDIPVRARSADPLMLRTIATVIILPYCH